jgi:hypothetical protein
MRNIWRNEVESTVCVNLANPPLPNRRTWIQGSAAILTVLYSAAKLKAQEAPLSSAIASMSAMTGSHSDSKWLEPVTGLVSAILEDSKSLRSLQLGSIEMATRFSAE